MLWMSDMQCAFVQNESLCAVPCIGKTFPCMEPAVGDVVAIKYDYHVKFHSQYFFQKFISEVPHLRMTTYNRRLIYTTVTPALHR